MHDFFQHRDKNAHGVVAEHGALGNAADELGLAHCDGQAVVLINVHHHRQIGAAVAHVNNLVVADAKTRAKLFEHGNLAPACGGANDGIDFPGLLVAEARAEDVIRRNDALERRLNNLLRRGGDYVEMEFIAIREILERAGEERYVVLQADALAGLDEMLSPHAAEIRVMQNEIAQLGALLDEVYLSQALDLVVKPVKTDELAQHHSRVVEAECLVEIAGQQVLFRHVLELLRFLLLFSYRVERLWEACTL